MSTNGEHIEPKNDDPAGGWAALSSSLKHIRKEENTLRSVKSLLRVNQPEGFDCPGCAWPEPNNASRFEFCENGVKAVAFETTRKRVTPAFFAEHTVAELRSQSDRWLESQGRLTHPMRYNADTDHYEPVSWDDAFAMIGDTLKGFDDPNQAVFYTSGRTSNEAAFLYQLFGRMYGTNNFPDCSNMCHESSGVGLTESIGIGKGTVTIEDFEKADAIFVIGQNPGTNHPRMLTELQKASRRGAKIASFNPLRERGLVEFKHPQHVGEMVFGKGTPISTHYYQVLVGGDLAAIKGIIKHVLDAETAAPKQVLDHDFIEKNTTGFGAFAAEVNATTWEFIEQQSGLTRDQLKEAADVYIKAVSVICCWAMGLTQHKHSVPTIQMVANLLLLRGNIGKPGAGACPLRGHSNVQGDRTVGITPTAKPEFLNRLGDVFNFVPPRANGLDTVHAIKAMAGGAVKVFVSMGGNFVSATPDTEFTKTALKRCELTVQISTKLNRSHVVHGKQALILPCLGRSERDEQETGPQRVTVEDSMSMVHASSGRNPPASDQLLSEPAIVCGMAKATLGSAIDWDSFVADYGNIRAKIADVLPAFHNYNERIRVPGGFYLGNSARDREWKTQSGVARFTLHAVPDLTLPDGQLRLMTMRSHDQFNTTIYDLDDRYRGVYGTRMVIFMNENDIRANGLDDGDVVDVTSHFERMREVKEFRVVTYDIPQGCAAGYFPELNPLVCIDSFADKSNTPTSKFIPVTVKKSR